MNRKVEEDLLNRGFIRINHPHLGPHGAGERTLIISGLARSGTSMTASILERAGVYLGVHDEVVFEDLDLAPILEARDSRALLAMIRRRNAVRSVWGLKRPDLHETLVARDIGLFRNPLLILMFRDPAAIAQRAAISEHFDGWRALALAARKLVALTEFVAQLTCPMLLVSYEKAITSPEAFVDELILFCRLTVTGAQRQHMIGAVEPNRHDYLLHARRLFEGYVDCVEDNVLYGWCRQSDSLVPVRLTLFIDDRPVHCFAADKPRSDLQQVGIGEGLHGFEIDLTPFATREDAVIRVAVEDRLFTLANSGCTLAKLRVDALACAC